MTDRLPVLLKSVFGYDSFRPQQREIMEAGIAGRDVLAVLPTGAGKSLCYQLPALVRGEGVTLVVSPLIALMKDQVDALQASGVAATFLNSSLDGSEARHRRQLLDRGEIRLLYAAPERVMAQGFPDDLRRWGVNAVAVDEAHCISEWGHDFRPEYRQLAMLRQSLPGVPFMALTATATGQVRQDIQSQLTLRNPEIFVASFNRPNLSYTVTKRSNAGDQAIALIRQWPDGAGIIYVQSRNSAELMASVLTDAGIKALPYHAGLEGPVRARNQEQFLRDEVRVICATVAFGMGINKPDVRFVIHADLPKNIEGYYQETGRAGRDGLPSECTLLFSRADVVKNLRMLDATDETARRTSERQIRQMADFAESPTCRRAGLMTYFGEHWPEPNCGSCDSCLNPRDRVDATLAASKLLSCLFRIRAAGAFDTGLNHVADVLTGKDTDKVKKWGHERLSTWSIGRDTPKEEWLHVGREMIRLGYAAESDDLYRTVGLTDAGRRFLLSKQSVMIPAMQKTESTRAQRSSGSQRAGDIACDEGLFTRLRTVRKQLADARSVPPYVIFSDVALRHMASRYPQSTADFLSIPGVGAQKLADFGREFMDAVGLWLRDHDRLTFPGQSTANAANAPAAPRSISSSAIHTLQFFKNGMRIEDIMAKTGLARSTVCKHLADAIQAGKLEASPRDFYSEADERAISAAVEIHGMGALSPLHQALETRIPYETLHFYRAFATRSEDG